MVFEGFSFFLVYFSNQDLLNTITIIKQTRHLIVPNAHVMPSLERFLPAFFASLFITLTAGIVVSLMMCCLAMPIVKPRVFKTQNSSLFFLICIAGFVISGLIYFFLADKSIFLRARDYLFLSSRPGILMNNFYYKYTLYAAQAVNSPLQAQMKTCWIDSQVPEKTQVKNILLKSGWITIPDKSKAFLRIEISGKNLAFQNNNQTIVSVSEKKFMNDPIHYLKKFSQKTDHLFFLKALCFVGLFFMLPFVCFMILFATLFFLYNLLTGYNLAVFFAGVSMVAVAGTALLYLYPITGSKDMKSLKAMLASQKSRPRIEALRIVYTKKADLWQFQEYLNQSLQDRSIAEKYWILKILSNSCTAKNIHVIKDLIQDKALNVRYSAIKALSSCDCSDASKQLFKKIAETSRQWYEQYYALNAFRGCQ